MSKREFSSDPVRFRSRYRPIGRHTAGRSRTPGRVRPAPRECRDRELAGLVAAHGVCGPNRNRCPATGPATVEQTPPARASAADQSQQARGNRFVSGCLILPYPLDIGRFLYKIDIIIIIFFILIGQFLLQFSDDIVTGPHIRVPSVSKLQYRHKCFYYIYDDDDEETSLLPPRPRQEHCKNPMEHPTKTRYDLTDLMVQLAVAYLGGFN